ncbi:hypothetical protein R1flu_025722 [Riccia fluitans]|uniref:Uncharacterized protein n=1 Tax=Riccia fluitans TaxID=41844 RepID=A0ABD1XYJ8_9MARC
MAATAAADDSRFRSAREEEQRPWVAALRGNGLEKRSCRWFYSRQARKGDSERNVGEVQRSTLRFGDKLFYSSGRQEETEEMGKSSEDQRIAVSPQSIWSTNSSWSGSWSESVSSSKQSSEMSSPSTTASASELDAWELLNEVAGEVERLKMNEDRMQSSFRMKQSVESDSYSLESGSVPLSHLPTYGHCRQPSQSVLPLPTPACNGGTPVTALAPPKDRMPSGGTPQGSRTWIHSRNDDQKAFNSVQPQHRVPRNEGVRWNNRHGWPGHSSKGVQQKAGRHNQNFGGYPRTSGKPVEWNGLQQWTGAHAVNGGSGMRAVFLGNLGSSRESTGTGVFLPRCIGGAPDSRRKPACSAVLLPSRIVQVLNLNVDDMRSHSATLPAGAVHSPSEYTRVHPSQMYVTEPNSGAPKRDIGVLPVLSRKFQSAAQPHQLSDVSTEFSLPTEWTY